MKPPEAPTKAKDISLTNFMQHAAAPDSRRKEEMRISFIWPIPIKHPVL